MLKFIFSLLCIVTGVMCGVTVYAVQKVIRLRKNYLKATGTIAAWYHNDSEIGLQSYETTRISPVIEFTASGANYQFIGNYYATNMKLGQHVPVLYDPNDPENTARIQTGLVVAPLITGALMLAAATATIILGILSF